MYSSIVRIFFIAAFFMSLAGLTGCDTLGVINIPVEQMKEKYTTSADKYFSYKFQGDTQYQGAYLGYVGYKGRMDPL
jgi:hypothetical protein